MTTTKIAEREKAIRKKLRIQELHDKHDITRFYLQRKVLGIWWTFDEEDYSFFDILFQGYYKDYRSLEEAKKAIDKYVNYQLTGQKVIYHSVNYLTH